MEDDVESAGASEAPQRYLGMLVAGIEYALPIRFIREIRPLRQVTRIPGTPSYLKGLIDVHGDAVPVVDLRTRFSAPERDDGVRPIAVVAETRAGTREVTSALVGDELTDVYQVVPSDIQDADIMGETETTEYARGIIKSEDGLVVLIDLDRILDADEFAVAT